MPNPFPGMNPYLEGPRHWRDVHGALIYAMRAALRRLLPRTFSVRVEERLTVDGWDKDSVPDALVVQMHSLSPRTAPGPSGTAATLQRTGAAQGCTTPILLSPDPGSKPKPQRFIEVRTSDERAELIAVVEVLSPTNKTGPGRDEYKTKQRDLLQSGAHLLEIDLLRAGLYRLAPDEKRIRTQAGHFDYLVSLHRSDGGEHYEVWPIALRDRLPIILFPLTDEVEPVILDLQAIVNGIYDEAGHEDMIDYRKEPTPPLSAEDAIWSDALLTGAGLR